VISTHSQAMLYSPESLRAIEDISEKFRQGLRQGAIDFAKHDGRNLVADEDVWKALAVMTDAEWLTVKP
jgi:histone H3/H4